jgi:hypothetical protein
MHTPRRALRVYARTYTDKLPSSYEKTCALRATVDFFCSSPLGSSCQLNAFQSRSLDLSTHSIGVTTWIVDCPIVLVVYLSAGYMPCSPRGLLVVCVIYATPISEWLKNHEAQLQHYESLKRRIQLCNLRYLAKVDWLLLHWTVLMGHSMEGSMFEKNQCPTLQSSLTIDDWIIPLFFVLQEEDLRLACLLRHAVRQSY